MLSKEKNKKLTNKRTLKSCSKSEMRQKIINLCNQISSAVCLAIFAKGYQLIIWWHSLLGLTCVGIWLEQLGQCEVSLLFRPRWSQNWDGHLETVCLSSVNYDLGRKPRYNIRARNAEDKHKWVVMVRKPYHENNGIYDLNLKKKSIGIFVGLLIPLYYIAIVIFLFLLKLIWYVPDGMYSWL